MENNLNKVLSSLSRQLGIPEEQIKNSAQNGNIEEILKNADSNKSKKISELLNDPEKTKKLLNSPQAQALMKLLNNEGNK